MINKNSFIQSIPLANILTGRGLSIVAREGTPLSNITQSTVLLDTIASTTVDGREQPVDDFDAGSLSGSSDNESHNAFFDQLIDMLTTSVAGQVSVIKNIISPIVDEAAEKITTKMEENSGDFGLSYNIISIGLPGPLKNIGLQEAVMKNAGGIYANPDRYLKLSGSSVASVIELMNTGSSDFDAEIKEWVQLFAGRNGSIEKMWDHFFTDNGSSPSQEFTDLINCFEDKKSGVDYALAVFLICRKLVDTIPEETGMSLAEYKKIVHQYMDAAAVKLNKAIDMKDTIKKNGSLTVSFNDSTSALVLNEDVYLEYINGGGKNEVIFGALISGEVPYMVSALAGKEAQYQSAWDRHVLFNSATRKNKAFVQMKEVATSVLLGQLTSITDSEQELVNANSQHMFTISKEITEYVYGLNSEQITNVYDVALNAVALIRFKHTDAYRFLSTINDICSKNSAIDVREAALIATTEYVTDYLANQMKLV